MTVSIKAHSVGLRYRILRPLTLRPKDKRLLKTGGTISGSGRRQHVQALEDVSFELSAGDRLGLVGSNGAGKTTLLKMLYGIMEPTSGTLSISGRVDALFNINLGFRPEATGRRNIELRGLINGWTRRQIEEAMPEIIEFSELGDFIDMPFKSYSQGMAARLAFSVATTLTPEILLMDEWIGAGDAAFQKKAGERMNALTGQAGIVVLASHNDKLIQRVCNRVLVLEKGRVKKFAPLEKKRA